MSEPLQVNTRMKLAGKIKGLPNIELPTLDAWNYGPCEHHSISKPDCEYRACGGDLFSHQKVAVSWLYLVKNGMVADAPGVGKSNEAMALLALLKQKGELNKRAIVITNTPVVPQWLAEFRRFAPGLKVQAILPKTSKAKRLAQYTDPEPWDVLVVGFHSALKDADLLEKIEAGVLITDDVDALLTHAAKVHKLIVKLSNIAERTVVMNATVYRTNALELHAAMQPIGGTYLFGPKQFFEDRYIIKEWERDAQTGLNRSKVVGLKNGVELREKISPWIIRRNYSDISDIRMPSIAPPTEIWLDMHKAQRDKYTELQQGILRRRKAGEEEELKEVAAIAAYTYGGSICSGLPGLGEPDGPQASSKLDWFMKTIQDEWADEKVVVFVKNIGLVQALHARLDNVGVKYATVWGKNKDSLERAREVSKFWEDPECRVIVGTSAMIRSINLQIARIACFIDTPGLTPANVTQALGRIRRAGSKHDRIFPFMLLIQDSQESRYLEVLQHREAISNFIWDDETNAVFEKLSAKELMHLIVP